MENPWIVLALVGAVAGAMLSLYAVWFSSTRRHSRKRRMRLLEDIHTKLEAERYDRIRPQQNSFVAQMRAQLDEPEGEGFLVRLVGKKELEKIQMRLAAAGWRKDSTLVAFVFAKLFGPVLVGLVGFGLGMVYQPLGGSLAINAGLGVGAALLASYAFNGFVTYMVNQRNAKVARGLPDFLDLMVICAEAGQGVDAAVSNCAKTLDSSNPVIGEELRLLSLELAYLPDRHQAFRNFAERAGTDLVKSVISTLIQSEELGTPLVQSLRNLAANTRTERLSKAEERAGKLPVLMTIPLAAFILPALLLVILTPAVLLIISRF